MGWQDLLTMHALFIITVFTSHLKSFSVISHPKSYLNSICTHYSRSVHRCCWLGVKNVFCFLRYINISVYMHMCTAPTWKGKLLFTLALYRVESLPPPRRLCFDSKHDSLNGFEWSLMLCCLTLTIHWSLCPLRSSKSTYWFIGLNLTKSLISLKLCFLQVWYVLSTCGKYHIKN